MVVLNTMPLTVHFNNVPSRCFTSDDQLFKIFCSWNLLLLRIIRYKKKNTKTINLTNCWTSRDQVVNVCFWLLETFLLAIDWETTKCWILNMTPCPLSLDILMIDWWRLFTFCISAYIYVYVYWERKKRRIYGNLNIWWEKYNVNHKSRGINTH